MREPGPFDDDYFPPGSTKEKPSLRVVKPQAPEKPKATPLDWPDLALKYPPERRWAVRGWLGFGHITLLVGSGGIGKTLLAQQMASCLALGKPFIGDITGPLKCLMWACEDDHDELWRRQVQIAKWCDAGLDAFTDNLTIVPRHGLENTLVATEFGKLVYSPLIEELKEQADTLHSEVIILDNVGQLFGGGENDRHAVTAFLNALAGSLPGRAILLLAHPSRGAGSEFSGSSAWENVARTRLYLGATLPGEKPDDSEPTDNVRYLARRKANYSAKDWRKLNYADGALTPEEAETTGGIIASIQAGRAEKTIIAAIQRLATMGLHATHGSRSTHYLPKMLAEYKLDDGLPSRDITHAMRNLMLDGRIKTETIGKTQNRNPIIGLVVVDL